MLISTVVAYNIFSRNEGEHLAVYKVHPDNISANNTSPKSWDQLLQEATNAQNNSGFPAEPVIMANEPGLGGVERFRPTGIRQNERTTLILGTLTVDGYLDERPVSGELAKRFGRFGSAILGFLGRPTHKLNLYSHGPWPVLPAEN